METRRWWPLLGLGKVGFGQDCLGSCTLAGPPNTLTHLWGRDALRPKSTCTGGSSHEEDLGALAVTKSPAKVSCLTIRGAKVTPLQLPDCLPIILSEFFGWGML